MTGTPSAPPHRTRRPSLWLLGAVTAVLGLALAGSTTQRPLPPGSIVAGLDLSGLSPDAARAALSQVRLSAPQVTVRAGDRQWTLSATRLGWQVDAAATVRGAQNRTASVLERTLVYLGRNKAEELPLIAKVDPAVARAALEALAGEVNRAPVNAEIYFDKTSRQYAVKSDMSGLRVSTHDAVNTYVGNPGLTQLDLPVATVKASITTEGVQPFVDEGNRLMRPLTLTLFGGEGELTLTPTQVANLYWVRPQGIELDEKTIAEAIDRAERAAGRPVLNARFVPRTGRLVPVPEQRGLRVQREAAIAELRAAVLQPDVQRVELPAETVTPTLTVAQLPDPASLTVIATGSSTYKGSSRERVTNVGVAARKLTGYVVPAGEDFSFLNAVGRITAENGFASALVIAGGRTVEGIGGGVCQVSTTAFRALYAAGLPVVERRQHAYRVRWYDPQVGFEAAVYDPGVDLRMKNDTGGPLLIRAFDDPTTGQLVVRLYGVPQQRQVTVAPAVVVSHTPAPAAQVLVNPNLKSGQRRQVDWAADGYNLFITRTITDDAGSRTEKLSTNYKPWRAVFEVGPASKPKPDQPAKPQTGRTPTVPRS